MFPTGDAKEDQQARRKKGTLWNFYMRVTSGIALLSLAC
jgi:hypothetical protein